VHGEKIDKNGDKYIGGFNKNGEKHGKGSEKTSGYEIEGEYEDGKLNGHAFKKYKIDTDPRSTLECHYKHGKKNGLGKLK
jgi:hypothetical protein